MGIKLNGWDALDKDIDKLVAALQREGAAKRILNVGGDVVLGAILDRTPVGPGILGDEHLRDILRKYPMVKKRGGWRLEVGIRGYNANKAIWLEYGHGGPHPAPAHPFVRPAFDQSQDAAANAMQAQVAKELR